MIRFGTGGWRAEIGVDFIKSNICLVGQGVCNLMKEEEKCDMPVIIGYDRRFLSPEAGRWLAEVLAGNGVHTYFLRRSAPTPLVMHTVKKQGLHYGLEVTASHNPYLYNGIKLIVDEGRDADVDTTNRLEALIASVTEVKRIPFEQAVEEGLIDQIGSLSDALNCLYEMIN